MPIIMPVSPYPIVEAGLRSLGFAGPVLALVLLLAYFQIHREDQIRYLLRGSGIVLLIGLYAANIHSTVALTEQEVIVSRMLVGRTAIPRDQVAAVEVSDVQIRGMRRNTLFIYTHDGKRVQVRSSGQERETIRHTLVEHLNLP